MVGQDILELDFKTVRAAVQEYFNRRLYSDHHINVIGCNLPCKSRFTVERAQPPKVKK